MLGFGIESSLYLRTALRLVYPAYCQVCRKPIEIEQHHLCGRCAGNIQTLKAPACLKCARPLPPFGPTRTLCGFCRAHKPHFYKGYALLTYEQPTKQIFYEIKYGKKPWLLQIFNRAVTDFTTSHDLTNCELIVPVPMDRKREKERGFNQATLISKILAQRLSHKVQIHHALKRRRPAATQSTLRRSERLSNLQDAFKVRDAQKVLHKHILLVDDIFTTGSTLNECARTLLLSGAQRVDFLTIARGRLR